jgi:tetratricopeptide (TPR) repeat protein
MSVVSREVTSTPSPLVLLLLLQAFVLPACDDSRTPSEGATPRTAASARMASTPRRLPPSARRAQAEYAASEAARLLKEDDPVGARQQLEAALALEPMNRRAQMVSGRAYHHEGRTAEALQAFQRALDIAEDLAVREWMGLTYLALRETVLTGSSPEGETRSSQELAQAALEQFQIAVALEPSSANARHNLGYTHRLTGEYPESAHILEKLVEEDPQRILSMFELGMTLEAAGRRSEALATYERVLGVMPGHEKALLAVQRLEPEGS